MKIAFFVGRFPVRSETFILQQIAGLLDRGHDVHIYASAAGDPDDLHSDFKKYGLIERTRFYRRVSSSSLPHKLFQRAKLLCANAFRHPALVLRALNLFKYGRRAASLNVLEMALCLADRPAYDIVHCHFGPVGEDAAILIDLGVLRGKLVATFHSYDVLRGIETDGACYRRLLQRADAVHSISEYNRKWLERFGFAAERIHYHPMGIDVARFSVPDRRYNAAHEVRILTIARLAPEKGLEHALAALAAIHQERPELRLHYRIIGGGPLAPVLQARAEELGLSDIVEFSGFQDQEVVRMALRQSDLFLLPSLAEALPIAIMEAMASGLPVVATDVGGNAELVRDDETGRLVRAGDARALKTAILDLLERCREWRRLGEAGHTLVAKRHDTSVLSDRLAQHYRTLMGGSSTVHAPRRAATVAARKSVPRAADGGARQL